MTSVKQINNDDTVNKTFSLLDKMSSTSDANSSGLIVQTVSNLLSIVSSSNGSSSSSNSNMNKAMTIIEAVIDSQLASNNSQTNKPIVITTANIEIKAAKLNTTDKTGLTNTVNSVLNSNDNSTTSTKVKLNDDFMNKLGNVSGASIAMKKWNINPYANSDSSNSNITSSVVSFEVKDKNQGIVSMNNLSTPIQIQIPKKVNNNDDKKATVCKYFNKNNNTWTTDGLSLSSENNDSMVCNCSHLTDFAGSLDLKVANTITNTDNTDVWYTTDANFGVYSCVIYFGSFMMISLLLSCFKFSKYDSKIMDRSSASPIRAEHVDMTQDPMNKDDNSLFAKRQQAETHDKKESENEQNVKQNINNISPIYAIFNSKNNLECRRRVSGFVIYLMLVSMFLACLYSSPDLDVFLFLLNDIPFIKLINLLGSG